jgi:MoxR-like ATPase
MTTSNTPSKGARVAADVSALLRARNPLLWIVTKEEARVEGFLAQAAQTAGYTPRVWDIAQGVAGIDGKKDSEFTDPDTDAVLKAIRARAENGKERGVWIMRDLAPWLVGPAGVTTLRQLRNLARLLPGVPRDRAQAIIVLSTSAELPPEIAGHATVIEWPLPDRSEIAAILDAALDALPENLKADAAPNGTRDAAIDAAVGLSGEEAAACYARSLVQSKKIDPKLIGGEKKRIIARERVLEWFDPIPGGLDAVGGLDNLKDWLVARKSAYSQKARDFGLPVPKGTMVVGVSGCGKSLLSKAIATTWEVPLLRVDLGALKSKFVGESEGNLRKVFRVVEAIGRCVLWFDEVEKALQGATGGAADGGVSSDALGAILTWMQERTSEAFVIMTANDVSALPPEFLRKGRFDEMWFVDLPNDEERVSVLKAALTAHGRKAIKIDHRAVAEVTKDFTGAEIAAIVPDALYVAFAEDREITTGDLIAAAKTVVPLAKTADAKIKALRDWADTRARKATRASVKSAAEKSVRALDL